MGSFSTRRVSIWIVSVLEEEYEEMRIQEYSYCLIGLCEKIISHKVHRSMSESEYDKNTK